VQMKDSVRPKRVDLVISSLVTIIHQQAKYWKITDMSLDHLIRMAKKSGDVYAWLRSQPKYLDNLIGWLNTYPEPPASNRLPAEEGQISLLKPQAEGRRSAGALPQLMEPVGPLTALEMQMRAAVIRRNPHVDTYAGERDAYSMTATGLPTARKKEALQLIKDGKALDTEAATDSDVDFSERVFKVGEMVDCQDTVGKWLVGMIVRVEGTRVEVTFVGWPPKWNETLDVADTRMRASGSKISRELIEKTVADARAASMLPVFQQQQAPQPQAVMSPSAAAQPASAPAAAAPQQQQAPAATSPK